MSMTEARRAMAAEQHCLRLMVGAIGRTPAVAVRERLQGYEDAEARVEALMVLYLERARAGTFAHRTFEDMSAKRTSMNDRRPRGRRAAGGPHPLVLMGSPGHSDVTHPRY